MKLNFLVPTYPNKPSGGHKIIYEYANIFAEKGYDVIIYHIATLPNIVYHIPHCLRMLRTRLFYARSSPNWFHFNSRIKLLNIPKLADRYIRDADVSIGTMWATALQMSSLSSSKGKKINLIQGYEIWNGDKALVHSSYRLPFTHIVISDFLADKVERISGVRPFIVYNPVDTVYFHIQRPIDERDPHSVSMMYSQLSIKNSYAGIDALRLCHKEVPDLHVELFGVFPPPKGLEPWIHYSRQPHDLNKIYNATAIFLSPSKSEGWGLPATEAMNCGCALVCTNIEGHKVYAKDGLTASCVDSFEAIEISKKILTLLQDNNLRISLAHQGHEAVQQFSMENAFKKMEWIITS